MEAKDILNLQEAYLEMYSPEKLDEAEKWIQKAIKKPGSLHKQLGVPAGEKIPAKELAAAARKGGKLGKRARLAQTLKSLNKEEVEQLDEISADTALAASKEAGKRSGILAGLSGGDPKVKAKAVKKREQAERLYTASAKRRLKAKVTPVKITREEYDFILSHLLDEGYTNTLEGAEVIASNMSDEWILSIVEAKVDKVKTKGMNRYVAAKLKSKMRNDRNLDPEQRASDTADTGFRRWHHSQKRGE